MTVRIGNPAFPISRITPNELTFEEAAILLNSPVSKVTQHVENGLLRTREFDDFNNRKRLCIPLQDVDMIRNSANWLTVPETAKVFGTTDRVIMDLIVEGKLVTPYFFGDRAVNWQNVKISPHAIHAYLESVTSHMYRRAGNLAAA